ncbi:hypothetical protein ATR01nite_08660 [Acetobacter tropicalis]|uniref:Uncharacterized protein n=1 Tax=Acetobacter tropicalis TaxID=104102 RepID=A0A511FKN2_9PROT|nr:hypothetical protein ATR01nite_08660 [Acetobacter tropicalis]
MGVGVFSSPKADFKPDLPGRLAKTGSRCGCLIKREAEPGQRFLQQTFLTRAERMAALPSIESLRGRLYIRRAGIVRHR